MNSTVDASAEFRGTKRSARGARLRVRGYRAGRIDGPRYNFDSASSSIRVVEPRANIGASSSHGGTLSLRLSLLLLYNGAKTRWNYSPLILYVYLSLAPHSGLVFFIPIETTCISSWPRALALIPGSFASSPRRSARLGARSSREKRRASSYVALLIRGSFGISHPFWIDDDEDERAMVHARHLVPSTMASPREMLCTH